MISQEIQIIIINLKILKNVTWNRTKHWKQKAEKKLIHLTDNGAKISRKGYGFLLGKMYFTGGDSY